MLLGFARDYSAGIWVWACRFPAMWWNQEVKCSIARPDQAGQEDFPLGGGVVELQQEQLRLLPGSKCGGSARAAAVPGCIAMQSASKAWRLTVWSLISRFSAPKRWPRSRLG